MIYLIVLFLWLLLGLIGVMGTTGTVLAAWSCDRVALFGDCDGFVADWAGAVVVVDPDAEVFWRELYLKEAEGAVSEEAAIMKEQVLQA